MDENLEIYEYLKAMVAAKASDLYITVGFVPTLRVNNAMSAVSEKPVDADELEKILSSILTMRQRRDFDTSLELNTALDLPNVGRFRINVMKQKQMPAIVVRRITDSIPDFEYLNLPSVLEELSLEKRGLILVTGIAGSGKSTTLASMIDYRNTHKEGHIITIEDPVEYYHDHKKSVVTQREVGIDTESYALALKNTLRQRPDVILVGEIRDREVMEQTLTITETGHLCMATIHTSNSYQAIERIVNMFPEDHAQQVRLSLSMNLKAIISQRLIPSVDGTVVPALEIMLNKGLIRELIVKGEVTKIREVIEQNEKEGMCSFDQALIKLYESEKISQETALLNSDIPGDLKIKLRQVDHDKDMAKKGGARGQGGNNFFTVRD